jgi:hypothetical protein
MPFCVDTSALIECWTRYYPIDLFPGLWDRLDGLVQSGELVAPDEVLHELAKKQDELHKWAKDRKDMFLELDEAVQAATSQVLAGNQLLAKDFAQRTHADPFVIAVAQVQGIPIITQEGPGSEKRPTIPYVCKSLEVRTLTVVEFIREQRWAF